MALKASIAFVMRFKSISVIKVYCKHICLTVIQGQTTLMSDSKKSQKNVHKKKN